MCICLFTYPVCGPYSLTLGSKHPGDRVVFFSGIACPPLVIAIDYSLFNIFAFLLDCSILE